ncbi:MAG: DUF433 domain-containing protein [Bacteroidetes bacterium]|nr:DUF433 domain-containing protein [Bacteroidota bacterium]
MPNKLVNIDPEIMSGTPVFNGTRVPVHSLFDWLETETLDEFLDNLTSVSRKQAIEVLKLAEKFVTNEQFLNEATS